MPETVTQTVPAIIATAALAVLAVLASPCGGSRTGSPAPRAVSP